MSEPMADECSSDQAEGDIDVLIVLLSPESKTLVKIISMVISNQFQKDLHKLKDDIASKDKKICDLENKVSDLNNIICELECHIDDVEQYERRDTLIVSGPLLPPEHQAENSTNRVINAVKEHLKINIPPTVTMMNLILLLLVVTTLPGCHPYITSASEENGVNTYASDHGSPLARSTSGNCFCTKACRTGHGGFCTNDISVLRICDKVTVVYCGSDNHKSCYCCSLSKGGPNVACGQDGVCKATCDVHEFVEYSSGCSNEGKCCKRCPAPSGNGRCVGNSGLCKPNEYYAGLCSGNKCAKCLTCEPDYNCEQAGGVCFSKAHGCPCKYYNEPQCTCSSGNDKCMCCIPEKV